MIIQKLYSVVLKHDQTGSVQNFKTLDPWSVAIFIIQ